MDIKRILVPYDFSRCSAVALDYAAQLAEPGTRLYIIHVDELLDARISAFPKANGRFPHNSSWDRRRKKVMHHLRKVVPRTAVAVYEHHCLIGFPADEILLFAERICADLIVMGSHGRTGFSRLLMGSVAERVMRKASSPVLVIKPPHALNVDEVAKLPKTATLPVGDDFVI